MMPYNQEHYFQHKKEYRTREQKSHAKLKVIVLGHYAGGYPYCVLCGEPDIRCLSLDHINGNGNQHRRAVGSNGGRSFYYWIIKNDFPDGYRTLCMNCQWKERDK